MALVVFQYNMEKFAAIDIGSNAIRLTLARPGHDTFELMAKFRVPLRLGTEAFGAKHQFSQELIDQTSQVFMEFRSIMDRESITHYRAIATSACRDAANAKKLFDSIFKASQLKVETISGHQEARMILKAISKTMIFKSEEDYLLFDLGGGSLELSQIEHTEVAGSKSFDIGTVRLLTLIQQWGIHSPEVHDYLSKFQAQIMNYLDVELKTSTSLNVVGTGGNFRRLMKLKRQLIKGRESVMDKEDVAYVLHQIEKTTELERIKKFRLRPDRAEIIHPALILIKLIIDLLPVKAIYAPKVGLIEGILFEMMDSLESSHPLSR
jgi:exopolyphosphatase / guanosine-5'-triphosphate,3'-diphosphate pyrophosphatase